MNGCNHEQIQQAIVDLNTAKGKMEGQVGMLLSGQQEIFAAIKTLSVTAQENRGDIITIKNCTRELSGKLADMCQKWSERSKEVDLMFGEISNDIDRIDDENNEGMLGVARKAMRQQVGKWLFYTFLAALSLLIVKGITLQDIFKLFGK